MPLAHHPFRLAAAPPSPATPATTTAPAARPSRRPRGGGHRGRLPPATPAAAHARTRPPPPPDDPPAVVSYVPPVDAPVVDAFRPPAGPGRRQPGPRVRHRARRPRCGPAPTASVTFAGQVGGEPPRHRRATPTGCAPATRSCQGASSARARPSARATWWAGRATRSTSAPGSATPTSTPPRCSTPGATVRRAAALRGAARRPARAARPTSSTRRSTARWRRPALVGTARRPRRGRTAGSRDRAGGRWTDALRDHTPARRAIARRPSTSASGCSSPARAPTARRPARPVAAASTGWRSRSPGSARRATDASIDDLRTRPTSATPTTTSCGSATGAGWCRPPPAPPPGSVSPPSAYALRRHPGRPRAAAGRLADLVEQVADGRPRRPRSTSIAHSQGGVVTRLALAELLDRGRRRSTASASWPPWARPTGAPTWPRPSPLAGSRRQPALGPRRRPSRWLGTSASTPAPRPSASWPRGPTWSTTLAEAGRARRGAAGVDRRPRRPRRGVAQHRGRRGHQRRRCRWAACDAHSDLVGVRRRHRPRWPGRWPASHRAASAPATWCRRGDRPRDLVRRGRHGRRRAGHGAVTATGVSTWRSARRR